VNTNKNYQRETGDSIDTAVWRL